MDYCGPVGIPYTDFLDWDDLSRNAALAWSLRKAGECGGCGTVRTDWLNSFDEDGEPVANELAPPFHAVDVFCPGCAARERHERAVKDGAGREGFHTGFRSNPDAKWDDPPASL